MKEQVSQAPMMDAKTASSLCNYVGNDSVTHLSYFMRLVLVLVDADVKHLIIGAEWKMRQHDAIDNSDWYQLSAERETRQLELR